MIVQKENGLTDKGKISTSPPRGQNPNGGCPQAVCHVELRRTRAARQRGFCSSTSSSQPGNNGKQGQNKTWGASSTQELFCKAGVANGSGCFSSSFSLSLSLSLSLGTNTGLGPSKLWLHAAQLWLVWTATVLVLCFPWQPPAQEPSFQGLDCMGLEKMTSRGPAVTAVPSGQLIPLPITGPEKTGHPSSSPCCLKKTVH